MKIMVITGLLLTAPLTALPQGKVTFGNDAYHLITFTTDTSHLTAAYTSLAGMPVPQSGTPGPDLDWFTVELLAGPGQWNLYLVVTGIAGQAGFPDGRIPSRTVTVTGIPGGTPAFFQVRVWETAAGSWNATQTGAGRTTWLHGESPVFSAVPGSFLPNSIVLPIAPSYSAWANGPIALEIAYLPEPSAVSLGLLGAAVLMLFRGRDGRGAGAQLKGR